MYKAYKKIDEIAGIVWKVLAYILAVMLFLLVVVVFWQVISRFILKDSSGWTQEIGTDLFVWASFFGAALAIRSGAQISMTLVVNKARRPVKQVIQVLAALVCEVFYAVFTASGFAAVEKFSSVTSANLGIPMSYAYAAIPVSGIIMLCFGLLEIIKPIVELATPPDEADKT